MMARRSAAIAAKIVALGLTLGCAQSATESPAASAPRTFESEPVSKPVPPPEPLPSANPEGASAPASEDGATLSEEELLTLLLDSRFHEATPDSAVQRLGQVGDVRMRRPVPSTTEVVADGRGAHMFITYVRQEQGSWQFAYAKLKRDASSAAEAKTTYERFVELLRLRFGKPVWRQEGPPVMLGFKAGGLMEASVMESRDATGVELMFSEPQGEAE
jgi:hypothetical protein